MTAFMLVCVIFLVIAVIIWRPKNFGRYPVRALRPKYKALGAPIPVTPIPGVDDGAGELLLRGSGDGAEGVPVPVSTGNVKFELEDFNVRTLYDKLEDQTLHMTSQLARHQADLRGFYERITQQTEKLKDMLNKMDVSALIKATQEAKEAAKQQAGAGTSGGGGEQNTGKMADQTAHEIRLMAAVAAGGTGKGREDELMLSLQLLLQRLESGQFPVMQGM